MKLIAPFLISCLLITSPVLAATGKPCKEENLSLKNSNSITVGMSLDEVTKGLGCAHVLYDRPYPNNPSTASYSWQADYVGNMGSRHTVWLKVYFDTRTGTVKDVLRPGHSGPPIVIERADI